MSVRSCLYVGTVMHRRLRPRAHKLRYRIFWMLIDLDEVEGLSRKLRLFSHNRFNAFSLHDRDHGEGADRPLKAQVEAHLDEAGIEAGGAIRLLAMPRILGYSFNPLSVYFCYRGDGALAAILYEVHNTFGERHSYLLPVAADAGATVEQECDKGFYVSPFLGMKMRYAFRVAAPDDQVMVTVRGDDADGPAIVASLAGERKALSDAALIRLFVTHPLLTLKVIGAIHWHALKMVVKGYRPFPHPSPPKRPVTISHGNG